MTAPEQGNPPTAARNWLRDLAERVVTTFAAGFLGAVSLDVASITALGWKAWLVTGGVAGGLSVLKGLAARFVGSSGSASLDPKNVG